MALHFRKIEPKDNPALAAIIRKTLEEFGIPKQGTVYSDPTTDKLSEVFVTPRSIYFVAEEDGRLLGGCGIYPTPGLPEGCAELVRFFLDSSYRGKGIGRQLMDKATDAAREMGYTQLYLESFPELSKAVSMYEKAGYRTLPHALGNTGHFSCTLWMLKDL